MGTNPFDQCLSKAPVRKKLTLQEVRDHALQLTQSCDQQRMQHRRAWEEHKREHHERRLEQALEHEALDESFVPTVVRHRRDTEDDVLYARFTSLDQLLELPTHEEYLRARRAWDRRHKVEDLELNVEVGFQVPTIGGRQVWAMIVTLFASLCFFSGVTTGGATGFVLIPLWLLMWVVLVRLPILYAGTFSGGIGGRGASGTAV